MMLPNKDNANIGLLVFAFLIIGLSHLNIIENIWTYSFDDGTYSHAYLIVLITGYLYWDAYKQNGLVIRETFNLPFFVIFLGCLYLTHIMSLAQIANGTRVMILLTLISSICVLFKANTKSLFPAAFLIFLLPIWGLLNKPLQELSVIAVTQIMSFTPIPIFVEGNFITIPAGVFEIAGGCSGLRYLLVSLAISSLYIYLYLEKLSSATKFLLVAILGALITNWIRITLLILIGHETDMQSPLMEDHNNFGWYLYIPFMIGLFYYGQKLSPSSDEEKETPKKAASVNFVTVIAIVLPIAVSFSFKALSYSSFSNNNNCQDTLVSEHLIQPTLHNVNKACLSADSSSYTIDYYFNPNQINSKTDYYANVLEPVNHKVIQRSSDDDSTILIVRSGINYKKITIKKYHGTEIIPPMSSGALASIKGAVKNNSGTKLQWLVENCRTNSCL